ncbi:MAG: SAM-dependent chlorinase/fluorinase [Candidatus Aenigmatarchaeota archaeon]
MQISSPIIKDNIQKPLITLTTDLGFGEEVAMMKSVILKINENALILDIRHDIPPFNLVEAAFTMESVCFLQKGFHVCVVDPGVGTSRKAVVIKTKRGDYLIGPDNGVLMPAIKRLGGVEKVIEINNEKYMNTPVSPVFHGRDIFAPVAAWLSKGVAMEELGKELPKTCLSPSPYEEAKVEKGRIKARIIHINRFGNVCINVLQEAFEKSEISFGDDLTLALRNKKIKAKFVRTFGDVKKGEVLVFKDDYGRIEIAINQGNFCRKYGAKLMDRVEIEKTIGKIGVKRK